MAQRGKAAMKTTILGYPRIGTHREVSFSALKG